MGISHFIDGKTETQKWTVLPKRHMNLDQSSPNGWKKWFYVTYFKKNYYCLFWFLHGTCTLNARKKDKNASWCHCHQQAVGAKKGRPWLPSPFWSPGSILAFFQGWVLTSSLQETVLDKPGGNSPCWAVVPEGRKHTMCSG